MTIVSTDGSLRVVVDLEPVSQSRLQVFPQAEGRTENFIRDSRQTKRDVDQYARRLIQHKAHQLVGRAGLTHSDVDDLAQEMWVDLLQRLPRFDSKRAKRETFISRVVNHKVAAILRHRRAEMRRHYLRGGSLSRTIHDEDRTVSCGDMLNEDIHALRTGQARRSHHEHARLQFDLRCVITSLPADQGRLCNALKTATVSQVSRDIGVHRATLHDSICRLRRRFEDAGLKSYL